MAKIETAPVPFGALTVHSIVSAAGDLYSRFNHWREVRRTVRLLSALDQEQLDDLGLTPGDIERFARRGHF